MRFVPYRDGRSARRQALDRPTVVLAALALLDEVGLDALTMRALAGRLGVKAASLYRHVRDKEELLVLLADEVSGTIPLVTPHGPWKARLSELAHAVRRGLGSRRDAARLLATTAPIGPRRLRLIETVLVILRSAGLGGRDAVRAAHHLNNFLVEFVADEGRYAEAARAAGSRRKLFGEVRRYFRALPPEEFPVLVELADLLAEDDPDGQFRFGLDVWIRGVERLAERSR